MPPPFYTITTDLILAPSAAASSPASPLSVMSKGEKVMEELPSHHQMIITGRQQAAITQIARVFGWTCEVIS